MKILSKNIQTEINHYLCKHSTKNQINYYGPHNNQETLNGYPRTLINILTNPDYRKKEQCILITQERLTHPTQTIQNVQQNLKNITQDTIKLTKTLTKTLKKEHHPQKQKIIQQIIQTLNKLTKTLITKQKTLTNTPTIKKKK